MKATAIDDLFTWSVYQPDRRIDFNGFYWRRAGGGVLIDPMPLHEDSAAWLAEQEPVRWIVLTNADHLRAAPTLRERFGAKIAAPACDRNALDDIHDIDAWYDAATPLPDGLSDDIEVHWLRGGKTAAEAVLVLRPLQAIVFGDAVRSHASGTLRLLPDPKIQDRKLLVADIAALRDVPFQTVLLGDGDSLFAGGRALFESFVDEILHDA